MDIQEFKISFSWKKPVANDGYQWEDCEVFNFGGQEESVNIPKAPYLTEKDYSQEIMAYDPLADATLFIRFAELEPKKEDFVAWANENGMLVGGEKLQVNPLYVLPSSCMSAKRPAHAGGMWVTTENGKNGFIQPSESFSFWCKEHQELSFIALLWEFLLNQDVKSLEKIVEWPGFGGVMIHYQDRKGQVNTGGEVLFDTRNINPWMANIVRAPDVIKPAVLYAQMAVNRKLREYPLNVVLQMDTQGGLYSRLQPTSLLSAMWYQLMLALRGDIRLRRCVICGKWEDMKGHRDNWTRHPACASVERTQRFRAQESESKTRRPRGRPRKTESE